MTRFRDGLFGPTVILLSICVVITFALAFTYKTTKPIIDEEMIHIADLAHEAVLPGATSFEELDIELPEGIFAAFKADNGYVFESGARGYGGMVTYMVGFDNDGNIVGLEMFDSHETPGLGSKIANPEYLVKYFGQIDPDSVDAVTGATMTTDSLKNALKHAREAFETIKGAH